MDMETSEVYLRADAKKAPMTDKECRIDNDSDNILSAVQAALTHEPVFRNLTASCLSNDNRSSPPSMSSSQTSTASSEIVSSSPPKHEAKTVETCIRVANQTIGGHTLVHLLDSNLFGGCLRHVQLFTFYKIL